MPTREANADKAIKLTLSVPADLRRRMGEVSEPVNWSAIAAYAIELKLAELVERSARKSHQARKQHLRVEAVKVQEQLQRFVNDALAAAK